MLFGKSKTTQDFIPIKEIREDVVILKEGGMRMVLMVSSVNFALKSPEEQEAIIYQYGSFLNSLDFSIQVLMQSRELDINPYINSLEERMKEQPNDLIRTQTREYIDFIRNFTDNVNVMSKTFFIVVPYDPLVLTGNTSSIPFFGKKRTTKEELSDFNEQKTQLEQRVSVIQQGLNRLGIRVAPLGTEELVELYFKIYNPGENGVPSYGGAIMQRQ